MNPPTATTPRNSILIVEDDPTMRAIYNKSLAKLKVKKQVIELTSGENMLAVLGARQQAIGLALVDFNLGAYSPSGLEIIRTLKEVSPDITCILVTGETGLSPIKWKQINESPYIDKVLTKPIRIDLLEELVSNL